MKTLDTVDSSSSRRLSTSRRSDVSTSSPPIPISSLINNGFTSPNQPLPFNTYIPRQGHPNPSVHPPNQPTEQSAAAGLLNLFSSDSPASTNYNPLDAFNQTSSQPMQSFVPTMPSISSFTQPSSIPQPSIPVQPLLPPIMNNNEAFRPTTEPMFGSDYFSFDDVSASVNENTDIASGYSATLGCRLPSF